MLLPCQVRKHDLFFLGRHKPYPRELITVLLHRWAVWH